MLVGGNDKGTAKRVQVTPRDVSKVASSILLYLSGTSLQITCGVLHSVVPKIDLDLDNTTYLAYYVNANEKSISHHVVLSFKREKIPEIAPHCVTAVLLPPQAQGIRTYIIHYTKG